MSCLMSVDEHWAKLVWSENISTPIYVECNMYLSKVCVQEFSNFVSGLDIQLEKSEYDSPVRKKISCRWRNMTSHIPFFSSNWCEPIGLVVKTGCRELKSAVTLCLPSAIFRGTEPVSALTRALVIILYCCALFFFLLDFVSGNLVLTDL